MLNETPSTSPEKSGFGGVTKVTRITVCLGHFLFIQFRDSARIALEDHRAIKGLLEALHAMPSGFQWATNSTNCMKPQLAI